MTDTNSTTAIKDYVLRYEALFRQQDATAGDLKELAEEVKESDFNPREIAAMKRVAKLQVNGKTQKARDELAALSRVAEAAGMDLFNFDADA